MYIYQRITAKWSVASAAKRIITWPPQTVETRKVLTSEDLDVVANLARETGAYVLSDEIYARRGWMGVDGDTNLVFSYLRWM